MAIINFGGVKERVVTRKEFSLDKAHRVLKNEVIAIIGYGVQGPAQALNLKDNGFKVIIGQSPKFKRDWNRALADGWVPGKTLFDIDEAASAAPSFSFWSPTRRSARSGRSSRNTSKRATPCTSPTASPSPTRNRPK